jgi:hypothetical protein
MNSIVATQYSIAPVNWELVYSQVYPLAYAGPWIRCQSEFITDRTYTPDEFVSFAKPVVEQHLVILQANLFRPYGEESSSRWCLDIAYGPRLDVHPEAAVQPSWAWLPFLVGTIAGMLGIGFLGKSTNGGGGGDFSGMLQMIMMMGMMMMPMMMMMFMMPMMSSMMGRE